MLKSPENLYYYYFRMDNVPGHYGAHSPHSVGHALPIHHPHLMMEETQDKMLSVSGKKKCSYCGNELGIYIFVFQFETVFIYLIFYCRKRSSNDHRKLMSILPHGLF